MLFRSSHVDTDADPTSGSSTSSSTQSLPTLSGSNLNTSSHTNTGAIVGGSVAGAIVLLVLLICAFLFYRKRRDREQVESGILKVEKFTQLPTRPSLADQPYLDTSQPLMANTLSGSSQAGTDSELVGYLSAKGPYTSPTDGRSTPASTT